MKRSFIIATVLIWLPLILAFLPFEFMPENNAAWYYPWSSFLVIIALLYYGPANLIVQLVYIRILDYEVAPKIALGVGAFFQSAILTYLAYRITYKSTTQKTSYPAVEPTG